MLVLTRKQSETINIDGDIEVTVIAIQGNKVRLGIKAPDSIGIRRAEIDCSTHVEVEVELESRRS